MAGVFGIPGGLTYPNLSGFGASWLGFETTAPVVPGSCDLTEVNAKLDSIIVLLNAIPLKVWQKILVNAGYPNGSAGQLLENIPKFISQKEDL